MFHLVMNVNVFTRSSARSALGLCFLFACIFASEAEQLCNGRLDLCNRTLAEVAFAGTHNSFTTEVDGYAVSTINQNYNLQQQLDNGVRYVNFDVYPDEASQDPSNTLVLCHGFCSLGKTVFAEACLTIVRFLQENPNEVLWINMEDKANTSAIAAVMRDTGLADYAHTYNPSAPLTLGEMIALGQRVMVMRQDSISCMESTIPECEAPAWMHYTWALSTRTGWEFPNITSFTCDLAKTGGTPFFMISHWISPNALLLLTSGRESSAIPANQWDVLQPRVQRCWTEVASFPNFVVVDYLDHGHTLQVVEWLNDNADKSLEEIAALTTVPLPTVAPTATVSPTAAPTATAATVPPSPTTDPVVSAASARQTAVLHVLATAVMLLMIFFY